ncbi:PilZN3 domain-containing protein [Spirochaeta cellobiosiphila]|uniref:PilZN3 domain-containing protein n=1 Tax=Spirochaeta cellobiosiphila TaxID=504483 RepID=UPI0003FB132C|nr:PilZN3 domain-containing protein [Spirochaeta cellobiosiphila]
MAITTVQQLNRYLEIYKDNEVTFNKEIIKTTGLISKKVYLKVAGYQLPCVIYSLSLSKAKIIMSLEGDLLQKIRESSSGVSLRLCFSEDDNKEPVPFFIACRLAGSTPYNQGKSRNLFFLTMDFTQRPPDIFIETMGLILDARSSSKNRTNERIVVNESLLNKVGFSGVNAQIIIDRMPRKVIVRDISFGGVKVFIMGIGKFLMEKDAIFRLWHLESKNYLNIPGKTVRMEEVEGRKDIIAIAVQFEDPKVPIQYKVSLHNFFQLLQKTKKKTGSSEQ